MLLSFLPADSGCPESPVAASAGPGGPRRRADVDQPRPLGKEGQGKNPASLPPPATWPIPCSCSHLTAGPNAPDAGGTSLLPALRAFHQAGGGQALFLSSISFFLRWGPRTSKGLSGQWKAARMVAPQPVGEVFGYKGILSHSAGRQPLEAVLRPLVRDPAVPD